MFYLDDSAERAAAPSGINSEYIEPLENTGFNESALRIGDGTNIRGYFQTDKYFDRAQVCNWYRFRDDAIAKIRSKYEHVDFAESVGLHVRLGDFVTNYYDEPFFYVPRRIYYKAALSRVRHKERIVVFSDDIMGARALLGELGPSALYVEGSAPYEDLYLQTQCRDFICSPSTFARWGAWLGAHPDKVVVVPKEGPFRPGAPRENLDFWPQEWIRLRALRPGLDHYRTVKLKRLAARAGRKLQRIAGFRS